MAFEAKSVVNRYSTVVVLVFCIATLWYTFFIMQTNVLRYNVIIKKEGEDYVAYVPTLGISDFGRTLELAKKHIKEAIECHIEGLIKTKSEVPPPDTEEYYISHSEIVAPKGIKFAY